MDHASLFSTSPARLPLPTMNQSPAPKKRSLSDSQPAPPTLEPSPQLKEPPDRARDDNVLIATPSRPPRRVDLSARGLSLQMPPKELGSPAVPSGLGLAFQASQHEQRDPYGSPSSVLPRHSRGLDFSRAATNLHHSTLADRASPDSSPTITQRSMLPPSRRGSTLSMAIDSPRPSSSWGLPCVGGSEKGSLSRSVGSTNAMTSEASSSSSDDDDTLMEEDEEDESMISTPHAHKMMTADAVTPYEPYRWNTEDNQGAHTQSPISSAFSNYRRGIFGKRNRKAFREHPYSRNRTSSPDSSQMSESQSTDYFGRDIPMRSPVSRRESLSLGIGNDLHITSSNEDEDSPFTVSATTPGVVRRPVVRRSNMLASLFNLSSVNKKTNVIQPKTKNFARIKAALQEESAPVDNEVRRESEVVRQVRVKDVGQISPKMPPSPCLAPTVPNLSHEPSEMSRLEASGVRGDINSSGPFTDVRRTSSGRDFWHRHHKRSSTPPPHAFLRRHRSSSGVSVMSEDTVANDVTGVTTPPSSMSYVATGNGGGSGSMSDAKPSIESSSYWSSSSNPNSQQSFPQSLYGANPNPTTMQNFPTAADLTRKINNKRRREDEFDVNSFKRRAVSPGLSVQSSPVLGQSPVSNTGTWPARLSRENSVAITSSATTAAAAIGLDERSRHGSGDKSSSSSSAIATEDKNASNGSGGPGSVGHPTPILGPKRVGLQGMTDTNEALVKMSID